MPTAIMLNDKVYEAQPRGSRHCTDCDLYETCKNIPEEMNGICLGFAGLCGRSTLFRYNKVLTDKFNKE